MDARTCPPVTWSPTETRTEVSCPPVGNPRLVAPRVETDPLDSPPVLTAARSTRAVFGGAALCDPPHAPRVRVATTANTGSVIRRTEQRVTIGSTRGSDLGYDSRNESHFTGDDVALGQRYPRRTTRSRMPSVARSAPPGITGKMSLAPDGVDVGPVVVRGDDRTAVDRLQPIAVDVPDRGT